MTYWIFRIGAKDWDEDYINDLLNTAIENNFCFAQYEYIDEKNDDLEDDNKYQEKENVTRNRNVFKKVSSGDVIFLRAGDNIYSWGYAIKPRFSNKDLEKIKLNCDYIIETHHDNYKYRSDKYNGYIEFEDCECFYENLEDGRNGWGQRIDIDSWKNYKEEGIYFDKSICQGSRYSILREISEEDALEIARKLTNDKDFFFKGIIMDKYINLLKQNKNLILTGAPGTGKTHLAKQIAYELCIDNKNASEKDKALLEKDFEYQCGFVQFHPSYDYTDFVEGLRPVNNGESNIGFERRDGVFKEFCKRALDNLNDVDKYKDIIRKYLISFINKIDENLKAGQDVIFEKKGGTTTKVLSIKSNFYDDISKIEENDKDFDICIKFDAGENAELKGNINKYINWYLIFKDYVKEVSIDNILVSKLGEKSRSGCVASYLYAFLLKFFNDFSEIIEAEKELEKKNIEVKEEAKKFVFIIDEINRGEISKIFGELFFSIDPGYRGEKGKVKTQYQNLVNKDDCFSEGFFVPNNVYIIGTMNDIDRSVESMDFAMRRRFAWLEIKATDTQNMLKDLDNKEIIIKRMNSLNTAIENIEDLSKHYQIGASYFLKLENYYDKSKNNIEEAFESLWKYHLLGLLTEYLRGNPNEESILKYLKNAYDLKSEDTKNMNISKEPQEVETINNETQS